jgi:hypothetical protein
MPLLSKIDAIKPNQWFDFKYEKPRSKELRM